MIDAKTWSERVKFYDEPDAAGERLLAYGPSGSGKTYLIGTFPAPFVVDIDHGGKTLAAQHIPFLTIPQEEGAMNLVRKVLLDFKDRQGAFAPTAPLADRKTIGLDGYSALSDIVIWELTRRPGSEKGADRTGFRDVTGSYKPEMDHWGALRTYLLEITNILEDIAYRGYHVVATATAFIKENESVRQVMGLPEILGGFRDVVRRKYDYVLYMEYDPAGKYLGYTRGKGLYQAKMRGSFPPVIENPTYERLFQAAGSAK